MTFQSGCLLLCLCSLSRPALVIVLWLLEVARCKAQFTTCTPTRPTIQGLLVWAAKRRLIFYFILETHIGSQAEILLQTEILLHAQHNGGTPLSTRMAGASRVRLPSFSIHHLPFPFVHVIPQIISSLVRFTSYDFCASRCIYILNLGFQLLVFCLLSSSYLDVAASKDWPVHLSCQYMLERDPLRGSSLVHRHLYSQTLCPHLRHQHPAFAKPSLQLPKNLNVPSRRGGNPVLGNHSSSGASGTSCTA